MEHIPAVITNGDWNYILYMKVCGMSVDIGYYYIPQYSFEDKDIIYLKQIQGHMKVETGIRKLKKWVETGIEEGKISLNLVDRVDPRAYKYHRMHNY